ncbi:hypothetical protein V5O48_002104 [Marasmius crinis-equi]|uniref:Cutinase n=1 Tax=Marasmius crinis-equi TaxID=585013 RepID=A0ABR3FWM7_9AGAR
MAPVLGFALSALALISSVLSAPLEERQTACADVMVIYARGTTQQSPIGDPASVGALFRDDIKSLLGSRTLSFQGVDYPADVAGFLAGGDAQGSRTMASDLTRVATNCPNAKIVSSGYSQGAQLVHNSAKTLSSTVTSRISAVVTFGDPYQKQAVGSIPSSKVKVICHTGDSICEGGIIPTAQHTTYQQDAPAAAQFVLSKV